jgi:DNA polymerase-3 subunit alpha
MHELPAAMQAAEQQSRAKAAGQDDLFGLAEPAPRAAETPEEPRQALPDWSEAVRLAGERETLGLFLTGHPITEFEKELRPIVSGRIAEVGGARPVGNNDGGWRGPGRNVTLAGLVLEIRKRGTRTGFVLDDRSGRLEVSLYDEIYQQYRAVIARDAILVVEGSLRFDDFADDWRLVAKKILDIGQAREQYARRIVLNWPAARNGDGRRLVSALEEALRPSRGGRCAIAIRYAGAAASANVVLGDEWSVRPSRDLIERLGQLVGRDAVEVVYAPRVEG